MSHDLKFKVKYRVPTYIIYKTLTSEEEIYKFTQVKSKFENKQGGEFDLYNGSITGKIQELVENKKIVLSWQQNNWPKASELTLILKEAKGSECAVIVSMKNIPERDNFKNTIQLENVELGLRGQIFNNISNWLGYPQNKDDSEESD